MNFKLQTTSRQTIVKAVGSLLTLGLLFYLLRQQGWDEIVAAFQKISLRTIFLILMLQAFSRLFVAARWYSLLSSVATEVSYWQSLKITLAGLFAANFLPTTVGGDIVRVAAVVRLTKNRVDSATSVAADRLVGLAGMAVALPLGVVDFLSWIGNSSSTQEVGSVWLQIGWLSLLPERLRKLIARGEGVLQATYSALILWLKRPKALVLSLLMTWGHMACLFSIIRLLLADMQTPINFPTIAGLWSFTYFITLMPFSINGLGLREISIGYIFPHLGGTEPQAALTLGIVLRAMDILVSLVGALFITDILTYIRRTDIGSAPEPLPPIQDNSR